MVGGTTWNVTSAPNAARWDLLLPNVQNVLAGTLCAWHVPFVIMQPTPSTGFTYKCDHEYCIHGADLRFSQIWNGDYFEPRMLKSLGQSVQLGPHHYWVCLCPQAAHQDFVILDTHLIHEVSIFFCRCEHAETHRIQLMRVGWYPATISYTQTACTFGALHLFQLLTLQSKTTAYDFYCTMAHLTDNTGLHTPRVSLVNYTSYSKD